jgi:hypothetical protein
LPRQQGTATSGALPPANTAFQYFHEADLLRSSMQEWGSWYADGPWKRMRQRVRTSGTARLQEVASFASGVKAETERIPGGRLTEAPCEYEHRASMSTVQRVEQGERSGPLPARLDAGMDREVTEQVTV